MALNTIDPTTTKAWVKLSSHFDTMRTAQMRDMFEGNEARARKMTIGWKDFVVDYSKNIADDETMKLLFELASEIGLKSEIEKYFTGDIINRTEKRAVLHTALRARKTDVIKVDGENVIGEIYDVREKMRQFSQEIINGGRKGYSGKPFTDIVNIGIGGSDLGPAMVVEALKFYKNHLNVHFVSNVDGDHVQEVIRDLDAETTLFVIVSKTFTTQETLSNSETIRRWFLESASQSDVSKHFVAVSTNIERVTSFGIDPSNIFPMWDWVGGRFSLWSAVGLSISLSVGYDNFEKLLDGANEMDEHFRHTNFDRNIPVVLALLTIWYNNFFDAESHAIIPYTQYLSRFAPYLQQGIMESNGKSVGRNGQKLHYQTGNIVWGEPGTNSQHAFFQLIHQGTKLIPADFIGFAHSLYGDEDHHDKLMSNFFAQTEALLMGKTEYEVRAEFEKTGIARDEADFLLPFKAFSGNRPTNTILIKKLTPATLGSLIAMYEHKIFVEGVLWNIFSYAQWGVELGKQLANTILNEITSGRSNQHDGSTQALLAHYRAMKS